MKKMPYLLLLVWIMTAAGFSLHAAGNGEEAKPPLPAAQKTKCPKKAAVTVQVLKPEAFMEYQYFPVQAQPEIMAVKSPSSGLVSEIKVSEGSLVEAEQELLVLNAGVNEEIVKLEVEAARLKKILVGRQNWKVKSEKAIQAATRNLQQAQALLDEKKALASRMVQAPVAGIVHLLAAAGSETSADAVLLEIADPTQMLFQVPLSSAAGVSFAVGEKISGTAAGYSGTLEAEVMAVGDSQATLKAGNLEGKIKTGMAFTFKKLRTEHAAVIVIPAASVQKDGLGDYVYLVEKKKAKKSYITLGALENDKALVLNGLAANAPLIVSGFECLANNKKIRVTNPQELARAKAAAAPQAKKEVTIPAEKKDALKPEKKEIPVSTEKKAVAQTKEKEKPAVAVKKAADPCPKKVPVTVQTLQPGTFLEYGYFSGLVQPEILSVTSPTAGQVSDIKVSENSLVEKDQDLVTLNTGLIDEITALTNEVARKKKTLADLKKAKVLNQAAIEAAEMDYQARFVLLAQKMSLAVKIVKSGAPGMVQSLKVAVGAEILEGTVLMEIRDMKTMRVAIALDAADSRLFKAGEKLIGKSAGVGEDFSAEVVTVDQNQLVLRVDNSANLLREGNIFTVRKLRTEHAGAIAVPANALLKDSLGNFVYVVDKKQARKLYVTAAVSEAGKTLISSGLAAEQKLVIAGFDCLADGKKVAVSLPAVVPAEAALVPEAGAPALLPLEGKLKIGVHGTYYLMLGKNFKESYVNLAGFGGELSFRFMPKIDFWLSGGMAAKKAVFEGSSEEMRFDLIPLAAAVRYYLLDKGRLSAYAGAGANVFLVKDSSPTGEIKTTIIGFHGLAGGYYRFSRKLSGQLMAKFNLVKKDIFPESTVDDPLDLTGLELNLGLAFSF